MKVIAMLLLLALRSHLGCPWLCGRVNFAQPRGVFTYPETWMCLIQSPPNLAGNYLRRYGHSLGCGGHAALGKIIKENVYPSPLLRERGKVAWAGFIHACGALVLPISPRTRISVGFTDLRFG